MLNSHFFNWLLFLEAMEEGGRRQGGNLNDDLILHFGYLGNFLVIIISALYSPSIGDRVTRIKVNMWCQTISLGGSTQASLSFTCPGYFTSFFVFWHFWLLFVWIFHWLLSSDNKHAEQGFQKINCSNKYNSQPTTEGLRDDPLHRLIILVYRNNT